MPHFLHMNPQLMRAPGYRTQLQQRALAVPAEHLPSGERRLARIQADFLLRSIGPIGRERQINFTPVIGDAARHPRNVYLIDLSRLKLACKARQRVSAPGDNHHAGGIKIQPMYSVHARVLVVQSSEETITILWVCLLYTSPSPRDQRGSRMPSSA